MDELDKIEFVLEVGSGDATAEEIDGWTRQLLHELQQTDVESAELARGDSAPKGAKGDPITTGSIAVAVLPAVLPKIVETIHGWLLRNHDHTIKFTGKVSGQTITFEGSSEDLQKILQVLAKEKRRK